MKRILGVILVLSLLCFYSYGFDFVVARRIGIIDNSETNSYTSDFSVGADGFGVTGGTVDGNIDGIGGKDNCLRLTVDGNNSAHNVYRNNTVTAGKSYRRRAEIYIPSTNSHLNKVRFDSSSTYVSTLDSWVELDEYYTATGAFIYLLGTDDEVSTFQDPGSDDVFYARNVRIVYP